MKEEILFSKEVLYNAEKTISEQFDGKGTKRILVPFDEKGNPVSKS